jgi:ABC-2 type transport system permease protein
MWATARAVFAAVLADRAAALLLIGAPVLYAVLYPSAYSGEVAVRVPTVIVDLDHTAASRALVQRVRAVQQAEVAAELRSTREAETWLARGRAYAAVIVPAGFGARIAQGRSGEVALVGHGAYLLRASTALEGVAVALGAVARDAAREQARTAGAPMPAPLALVERPLFNTREGYGAAVFPGVAFVIVQQALIIGLAMLAATARERLGRSLRLAPAQVAGAWVACVAIGLASSAWFAGAVFWIQDYPRAAARPVELLVAAVLFAGAVASAALAFASAVRTRERPLQLWLATSLPIYFLAGLSWPVEAMPAPLAALARLLPTTPGLELMIGLNQMGGRLADYAPACLNLAVLALVYGALAVYRYARSGPPAAGAALATTTLGR